MFTVECLLSARYSITEFWCDAAYVYTRICVCVSKECASVCFILCVKGPQAFINHTEFADFFFTLPHSNPTLLQF